MVRATLLVFCLFSSLWAQHVPVQEVRLENGMKLLLVQRKGAPNIAAGWIAKVGSVNERPGVTGISHLFEHMMFKGTQTIGTKDIEKDLKLNLELDRVKGRAAQGRAGAGDQTSPGRDHRRQGS